MLKRRVILDIEANGLINPTKIWCIVLKDVETNEKFRFKPKTEHGWHSDFTSDFLEFIDREVGTFIGHNLIGYDMPVINSLIKWDTLRLDNVVDTLVLSRLLRPTSPPHPIRSDNRQGGHSLEAWGQRLGYPKIDFHDFTKFSDEMLTYCERDVDVCHKVYNALRLESAGFSPESITLEHKVAKLLWQQERNGFYLDKKKALDLSAATFKKLYEMDAKLQQVFPPVFKFVRDLEVKLNKDGTVGKVPLRILTTYQTNPNCKAEPQPDGNYKLYIKQGFNPKSPKNVAERLLSVGWEPTAFTEKGAIKTDSQTMEDALKSLLEGRPDLSDLQCLVDYRIVADRHQKAVKWLELVNNSEFGDGRVHGRINPIGAATHRCSHYNDNMANIASVVTVKKDLSWFDERYGAPENKERFTDLDEDYVFIKAKDQQVELAIKGLKGGYGWESRSCWSVPTGKCLVGADASGIQLRALAHYMNDPDYTKELLSGDIHEVNRIAAGIDTRVKSKTFIYAFLLGAGDEKTGDIVGCTEDEWDDLNAWAKGQRKNKKDLVTRTIEALKESGRRADRKTVFKIIKGNKIKKQFLERTPALKRLKEKDIPETVKRGFFHGLDGRKLWVPSRHLALGIYLQSFETIIMKKAMCEYQDILQKHRIPFMQVAFTHDEFEVETEPEYGQFVGQAIVNGIKAAGEIYKTNCPMDGEYKIGRAWSEVH